MPNTVKLPKHVTASGVVLALPCFLHHIVVNSHSSGTLKLWDNASKAEGESYVGNNAAAYSFPTGSGVIIFPSPIEFQNGCFATVGGTLNATLHFS